MNQTITLANGNGGEENNELIKKVFYKAFKNEILEKNEDAAVLDIKGRIAMSTDSFTVSPLFFSGANIGKLAICGTCNDLAMMGAKPKYMTIGVILEEGFSVKDLQKIVKSMKSELEINDTIIVSGDTKVMPRGTIDKIILNTTAIGEIQKEGISSNNISKEDLILVSRDIGCHGATIFASREGIELSNNIQSDCKSLYPIVQKLIDEDIQITALRDATRGGVSAVLNEWAKQSNVCIEISEDKIPVNEEVKGMSEILGFEAIALANEGTFCLAIKKQDAQRALEILKEFNDNAVIFGSVSDKYLQKVILNSAYGTARFLDVPTGELLPRIC